MLFLKIKSDESSAESLISVLEGEVGMCIVVLEETRGEKWT